MVSICSWVALVEQFARLTRYRRSNLLPIAAVRTCAAQALSATSVRL